MITKNGIVLTDVLTSDHIQYIDRFKGNWEQAIATASSPLLQDNSIDQNYIDSMIDVVKKNGPYINIGTNIALAHSRPEAGVNKMGMALLSVNPEVNLCDDKERPIKLWFVLAASDNDSHLDYMAALASLLGDDSAVPMLLQAKSAPELYDILVKMKEGN